jgi:mRNA-degrading endonuclease RelE of RelBE toxin-antitoxin system
MTRRIKYHLACAPKAFEHLDWFEQKHQRLIRSAVQGELTFQPTIETRNRKRLRAPAPFEAEWELRCGPQNRFRVFYEVDEDQHVVSILAGGIKDRNQLHFPGEEVYP